MLKLMQRLFNRQDEEKGASAVEYGLLVAAIAALVVIIVFALGGIIKGSFKSTCDVIANKGSSAANSTCKTD